jgi:Secretion system C-terminal sorting domain
MCMKKILSLLFILFSYTYPTYAQELHVNWTRFVGTANAYYAIPTRDGGIVFTGDAAPGSGDIPAGPYGGVMVGKMDSNRNLVWIHVYGGERGVEICQTPDGGYAVIADAEVVSGYVTGIKGDGDMWLLRLDSMGNFLWGNCYGSNTGDEESFSIAATKDNGFILLGASNDSGEDVPFHLGGSEFEYDWFVVKTDSLGNKQWTKDLGGSGDELSNGYGSILAVDTGYYLAGSSYSTDDDCTDEAWHPGVNTGYDYYLLKLTDSGNVVWAKSFGGSNDEEATNAVWDYRDNTVAITGFSKSTDYMVSASYGDRTVWTIKVDNNGQLLWAKPLPGYGTLLGGTSVALAPGGYVNLGAISLDGTIGNNDLKLFVLDMAGNMTSNTTFGSSVYDNSASVFSYRQGYITTGTTASPSGFTEGTNFGTIGSGGRCFISYLSCCQEAVPQTMATNEGLLLYPNPSEGAVNVVVPAQGTITVANTIGQTVYKKEIIQKQQTIETGSWAKGFYMVQWQGEQGNMATSKLVIR